ncbi:MAG: 4-alpha-glucanotransferase [Dissulfurimicrobium sp.]|uniref:4-alpha-glucanotransferase n=1 Tax=Dissulfurimicrobium sp. TaxID=2022436 RepID=UPI004049FCCD
MDDIKKELFEFCGIENGYWDIWGKWHTISDETVMRILSGMGVPLYDKGYDAALSRLKDDLWQRVLEPVKVVLIDSPIMISLNLPHGKANSWFEWAVFEETGASHKGIFTPSDLKINESYKTKKQVCMTSYSLTLPISLPIGYHHFLLFCDDEPGVFTMSLIVCPKKCYIPEGLLGEGRTWGPAIGLYAIRSKRNWGIGDFSDLKMVVERFSAYGAGIVGVNPVCTAFPWNPLHISPYSPSSRLFLNYLYLDIEAMPDFTECEEARAMACEQAFQSNLLRLKEAKFVDYEGVAAIKSMMLKVLYRHFIKKHLEIGSPRALEFLAFKRKGGRELKSYAIFNVLGDYFKKQDPELWGWPVWPKAYRDPDSPKVLEFGRDKREDIEFYQYVEWQAERQLAAVGQRSFELGLKIGLYLDLPIGVDRAGFDTWYNKGLFALDMDIGAPPDDFNLNGQDWGLSPMIPSQLKDAAYMPFINMLRRNMRYNGALRIDHVMGLMRLFWVPKGMKPLDGAYIRYPFNDLLGILALESHRNRCMVIGEDLGTVPDEVRSRLKEADVFSTRVLYFETRGDGSFKAPREYPDNALASVTTHDLPTLYGFWQERDIDIRSRLNLFSDKEVETREIVRRTRARAELFAALKKEGLVSDDMLQGQKERDNSGLPRKMTHDLALAIYGYLARCRSRILIVQMEDLIGELDQANLPGTVNEYPNWRRRLSKALEDIFEDRYAVSIFYEMIRFPH